MVLKLNIHCRLLVIGLVLLTARIWAAPVVFTIDETQSRITLDGSVLGYTLQEQGPGSLNTTFKGKILADVGASTVQFTGGSVIAANTNGVWKPGPGGAAGSAPADYAAQATALFGAISVKGALRNILLDVTSSSLSLTNGHFDASALVFSFPTNATSSFDYDAGALVAPGGVALTGLSTNKIFNGGTLSNAASAQTLVIQVDTTFKFKTLVQDDSIVHLTGMLVATQSAQLTITSIEMTGQNVVLHVQGAGSNPRLDSSADLKTWTTQSPTRSTDTNGVVLTLPTSGNQQFYRVAQ